MWFYDINYPTTLYFDNDMTQIYEERGETSFIGMKSLQLVSNVLETV
jgi:hypothetical protein